MQPEPVLFFFINRPPQFLQLLDTTSQAVIDSAPVNGTPALSTAVALQTVLEPVI